MSLQKLRSMTREARALSRNYRHTAALRRYLKRTYGRIVIARPSILIGEVLIALEGAPWCRLSVLAVLFVAAVYAG